MNICLYSQEESFIREARALLARLPEEEGVYCRLHVCGREEELAALPPYPLDLALVDMDTGAGASNGLAVAARLMRRRPYCRVILCAHELARVPEVFDIPHARFILKSQLAERLPAMLGYVLDELDGAETRLLIVRKDSQLLLEQSSIIYGEQLGRRTSLVTYHGEFSLYEGVAQLMQRMDPALFVQCHRSFLVNLRQMFRLTYRHITLRGGLQIPVSRSHYALVRQSLTGQFAP